MYSSNSPRRAKLREPLLPANETSSAACKLEEEDGGSKGISVAQAVYNVVNVYVGLGLLSKPYAIAEGGCISVFALALLCTVANVTGKLIVRGFAKLPAKDRTYAGLGEKAFGAPGKWLVLSVVTLEFAGALMVVLIFVWKNALLLAPWYLPDAFISVGTVAVVTTLAATPTVWALDFAALAGIGLLGVVASALIVGVLALVACYSAAKVLFAGTPAPQFELPLVGQGLPVAVGIFVLSLGGHAALPGVFASMAEPHRFDRMLDISIAAMFIIYASVGLAGWITYGWLKGQYVDVLITTNMAHDTSGGIVPLTLPGHWGARRMSLESTIMTLAVVAKSFTAISPVTAVLADLPEMLILGTQARPPRTATAATATPTTRQRTKRITTLTPTLTSGKPSDMAHELARHQRQQRILRTVLLWLVAAAAYPCAMYPHGLALVEAVTGAMCSMLASLALPCACWVAVYRDEIPRSQAFAAIAIAVVAAIGGAVFTTVDIIQLGT